MAAIGGPIVKCTVDGRIFAVAADQGAEPDLGGFTITLEPNGDGSARELQARKNWMVGGVKLSVDLSKGDLEFVQNIIDTPGNVVCEFTLAGGVFANGLGKIVGDLKYNTENSTATVDFSGPGKLKLGT